MNIIKLAEAGGLFSLFAFNHFFVDWLFQSHSEAMVKHNNAKIRAKHCLIYSVGFLPLMWLVKLSLLKIFIGFNILFLSHFYLDTYHFVFLWAKYIRRPPEMTQPTRQIIHNSNGRDTVKLHPADPKTGFVEFVGTTLGKILMITIDQISHLAFLFPIIWMILNG